MPIPKIKEKKMENVAIGKKDSLRESCFEGEMSKWVDENRPETQYVSHLGNIPGFRTFSKEGRFFGKKKGLFSKPFEFNPEILWEANADGVLSHGGFVFYSPEISCLIGRNSQCRHETLVFLQEEVLKKLGLNPVLAVLPDRENVGSYWTSHSHPVWDFA